MFFLLIFIILICFIFFLISRKMLADKNFVYKFFIGTFIFPFLIAFLGIISGYYNSDDSNVKADGFTISNYEINLNVNKNNIINVEENIGINFYENYHHGIFKFIPEWFPYTSYKGKTIKRKSIVSNLEAINDIYSLDTVKKKKRIKIGDPYEYVPIGLKNYDIKYDYNMGKDPFKGYDEFIFHAYGDYWGTEINDAKINITMPSEIEKNNISFYMDKDRKLNVTSVVDITVIDNKVQATFNKEKYQLLRKEICKDNYNCSYPEKLEKSLTVSIILPDKYFVSATNNYNNFSLIPIFLTIISLIILIVLWSIYGKDNEKKEVIPYYLPPRNFSSAEVGYIYGKGNSKKLAISLIIELASKKMLKIDEIKRKIVLTNLNLKPKNTNLTSRKIEIKKLKDIDESYEKNVKKWFNNLFKKEDSIVVENDFKDFDKYGFNLEKDKYISVKEYPKMEIKNENYDKENNEYLNKKYSLNSYEKLIYDLLFTYGDEIILKEHPTFYTAFSDISTKLDKELKWVIYDKKSNIIKTISYIILIISIIMALTAFFIIEDLSPSLYNMYYVGFLCTFLSFFLSIIMGRKTNLGEEYYSEVLGFKDFLENVEKDKLEELVSKMPNYFYDILPYTYVLNISKKWIKKFENIKMPEIDYGNFDISHIDSISSSVSYPVPSSSSSGCSSCGGGCSSCGGGCSSCGGGGSW